MKRGKLIGALILIGVIALVVVQRLDEPAIPPAEDDGGAGLTARPEQAGVPGTSVVPGRSAAETALPAAGETRVYTLDASQSEVYWRIYRAGAAARLGHNHVISMTEFDGSVVLASDIATAQWDLSLRVDSLRIDDPEIRARYGEEFESVPSEDDKAGTRRNMLTDRVLNGEVFPEIRLSGTGVFGSAENAELPLSIEILGRTIEQSFPATITIAPDSLTVRGEYRLTHADLGMEPFSAFGGIMAVGNDIDFTYRIHAVAGGR
jgi:hypothetical protein